MSSEPTGLKKWLPILVVVPLTVVVTRWAMQPHPPNGGSNPLTNGNGPVTTRTTPRTSSVVNKGWVGWRVENRLEGGGVVVKDVFAGAPAEKAGIGIEDVIESVNGEPATQASLFKAIGATAIGDTIKVTRRAPGSSIPDEVAITVDTGAGSDALVKQLLQDGSKALAGLQMADGLWPHFQSDKNVTQTRPGTATSALACFALAAVGQDLDDTSRDKLERGIEKLLALRAPDGGLTDPSEAIPHRVYANSLLVLALCAHDRAKHAKDIAQATDWLVRNQIDERWADWVDPLDNRYGAWNYYEGRDQLTTRADVSVASWALEALDVAGLSSQSPVWRKAATFLERCQNREVFTRDERGRLAEAPWRDGGFAFGPRFSKAGTEAVGTQLVVYKSYGSATADGLRGLLAVGGRDLADDRVDAALGWLARAHLFERNPGFPENDPVRWTHGIYYYYLCAFARALDFAKVDRIRVGADDERAWPEEMARFLAGRQDKETKVWESQYALMGEDSPSVATPLALLALCAARDRVLAHDGRTIDGGAAPPPPPPVRAVELPVNATAADRGRLLFRDKGRAGCTSCHADRKIEQAPVLVGVADAYLERYRTPEAVAQAFKDRVRDPDHAPALLSKKDAWPAKMPAFKADQLSDENLADLVEFLKSRTGNEPVAGD